MPIKNVNKKNQKNFQNQINFQNNHFRKLEKENSLIILMKGKRLKLNQFNNLKMVSFIIILENIFLGDNTEKKLDPEQVKEFM